MTTLSAVNLTGLQEELERLICSGGPGFACSCDVCNPKSTVNPWLSLLDGIGEGYGEKELKALTERAFALDDKTEPPEGFPRLRKVFEACGSDPSKILIMLSGLIEKRMNRPAPVFIPLGEVFIMGCYPGEWKPKKRTVYRGKEGHIIRIIITHAESPEHGTIASITIQGRESPSGEWQERESVSSFPFQAKTYKEAETYLRDEMLEMPPAIFSWLLPVTEHKDY